MGGLAGFCGSFEPGLLDAMSTAITARGPDDSGSLHLPAVGLGLAHRRLAINDRSQCVRQPMWDATGTVVISYDGVIHGFRELRRELVVDGYGFNSESHTEVILNLYRRDGDKLLERLKGVFAFAIWDSTSRSLLVARDSVGFKPLYYAETPKGFLFASELKALLYEPSLGRSVDSEAVRHHLLYGGCPSPLTMLQSARKLEPGHAMRIQQGRVTKRWRFHDPQFDRNLLDWPKEDAVVQVRKQLTRAVDRQLAADGPVGALLSEGLDSSAVVALAQRRMGKQKLQCFAVESEDPSAGQEGAGPGLAHAQAVAAHLNVELHTVQVGPEVSDELQRVIFHLDEPQADPSPINTLLLTRLARQQGMKVLLSGIGGDHLFGGYRRPRRPVREPLWSRLSLSALRAIRAISASLAPASEERRQIAEAFRYADLEGNRRIASAFRSISPELLRPVFAPALSGKVESAGGDLLLTMLAQLPPDMPRHQRVLCLEEKFRLADQDLNCLDKVSLASGVEIRAPLLDPELTALVARLPLACRRQGRVGAWVLRKAMEPYLPHQALRHPRTHAGGPLHRWLQGHLRPLVEDTLSERSLRSRGLFDPEGVRNLVWLERDRRVDAAHTIFSMVCIELWCRMFLDKPTPSAC